MELDCTFAGATPTRIAEIFTDPKFPDDFAAEVGVQKHRSEVSDVRNATLIEYHWEFATAGAPAIFRRFIPDVIALNWSTSWANGEEAAVLTGTFKGEFADPKVSFHGDMTLTAKGADVEWKVTGDAAAKRFGLVPGAVVAGALNDLFVNVLGDQRKVTERWLAG